MAWDTVNATASVAMRRITIDSQATGNPFEIDVGTPNKMSPAFVNDSLDVLPIWLRSTTPDEILEFDPNGAGATPIDVTPNNPSYVSMGTGGDTYYQSGFSFLDPLLGFSYSVNSGATIDTNDIVNPGLTLTPGGISGYPAFIADVGNKFYYFFNDNNSATLFYLLEFEAGADTATFLNGVDEADTPSAFQGSNQVLFYNAGNDSFYMPTVGAPGDPPRVLFIPRIAIAVGGPFGTIGYEITFSEAELNVTGNWSLVGNSNSEMIYYFDNQDGGCYVVVVSLDGTSYYAYQVIGDLIPAGDEVQRVAITPDS